MSDVTDDINDLKNISVVDEPQFDIMLKWVGFAVTFVVILLVMIYVSSYFARGSGRYIDRRHERGINILQHVDDYSYKFNHDEYDEEYGEDYSDK